MNGSPFSAPRGYRTALLLPALAAGLQIAFLAQRFGLPEPFIHDEFAYLLGADTFLEGRLTNPTPPEHAFFETFHVSMTPTYHSKYPPGQSAFLALGKLLFGKEIYGVWLSFVLAAMAVAWALAGAFPRRWALVGGLLAVLNSTLLVRWAFSFWGGSVAMLGGALFLGGWLRLYREFRLSAALWTSLGLFIMAFSRPLEGLLTSMLPLVFLLACSVPAFRSRDKVRPALLVFGTLAVTGLVVGGLNLAYNHALTGSIWTFPHAHWDPEASSHAMIQSYAGSDPLPVSDKAARYAKTFVGPVLWVFGLPAFWRVRTDRRVAILLATVLGVGGYILLSSRGWPHYAAPLVPMVIALLVWGGETLAGWKVGRTRIGAILAVLVLTLHFTVQAVSLMWFQAPTTIDFKTARARGTPFKRSLDAYFASKPGRHLILVRYLEGHSIHKEYVYNRADLPSAEVIWARDMGPEAVRELMKAYPDRRVWRLDVKDFPIDYAPYGDPVSPRPDRQNPI